MPIGVYERTEECNRAHRVSHKGSPWHKGKTKKQFPQLSNSGVKKGNIPWNKGKTKKEYPQLSVNVGEKNGSWGRRGIDNPNWKPKVEKICSTCKKVFLAKPYRSQIRRYCSFECSVKTGENSHFWKGGTSTELQKRINNPEWKKLRLIIYKRDNYTCQICGRHCYKDIQCHHIISVVDGGEDKPKNLTTLDNKCHGKVDLGKNQKFWRFYLSLHISINLN